MAQKKDKIIYWAATGLISLLMLFSAGMYIFNYDMISQTFVRLGFPTYIIYPLAAAKVLGLIAIWTRKSKVLKEWAYAGFFFDFLLAFSAHFNVGDGEYIPSIMAIILLLVSRIYDNKVFDD